MFLYCVALWPREDVLILRVVAWSVLHIVIVICEIVFARSWKWMVLVCVGVSVLLRNPIEIAEIAGSVYQTCDSVSQDVSRSSRETRFSARIVGGACPVFRS